MNVTCKLVGGPLDGDQIVMPEDFHAKHGGFVILEDGARYRLEATFKAAGIYTYRFTDYETKPAPPPGTTAEVDGELREMQPPKE